MSKLNRKFLISIGIILFTVGTASLYVNLNFIERYFLYNEKKQLQHISDILLEEHSDIDKNIRAIESSEDVIIVSVKASEDNDVLNGMLIEEFRKRGISLKKYWIWDKDYEDVVDKARKIKIYNQEKLNYSLLVEYILVGDEFVAIAKIIPSLQKTLILINKVNIGVFIGTGFILFLCISFLVSKITSPIQKIRKTSKAISELNFETIEISTHDELELLAEDINAMSKKLKESHTLLNQKNKQMEELLANVSHDLKTPISLIKIYACGLKDGLDDGTFMDTIIVQNTKMEHMVERLLKLEKLKHQECEWQTIDISMKLKTILEEYRLQNEIVGNSDTHEIQDGIVVNLNAEAIDIIYSNIISNAIKYAKDGNFKLKLYKNESECVFISQNHINDEAQIDINQIWEPFYVAEKSRNKNMSGTGLGLSIVKNVCEKYKIVYSCDIRNNIISFKFYF